ncbi:MAG: mRNA binding protein puf3 [Phylliscum demangeonii]|nr:MAG: mRNA binding protein puf3 [Phylliscum demangeonii]
MGLGQINTTRFLFDDEEPEKPSIPKNQNVAETADLTSYLRMNATEDKFPILRRDDHSGVLSASSAALDSAPVQSPGAENQSSSQGTGGLAQSRQFKEDVPKRTLRFDFPAEFKPTGGAHGLRITSSSTGYQKMSQRVGLPNLPASFSTGQIPTVKVGVSKGENRGDLGDASEIAGTRPSNFPAHQQQQGQAIVAVSHFGRGGSAPRTPTRGNSARKRGGSPYSPPPRAPPPNFPENIRPNVPGYGQPMALGAAPAYTQYDQAMQPYERQPYPTSANYPDYADYADYSNYHDYQNYQTYSNHPNHPNHPGYYQEPMMPYNSADMQHRPTMMNPPQSGYRGPFSTGQGGHRGFHQGGHFQEHHHGVQGYPQIQGRPPLQEHHRGVQGRQQIQARPPFQEHHRGGPGYQQIQARPPIQEQQRGVQSQQQAQTRSPRRFTPTGNINLYIGKKLSDFPRKDIYEVMAKQQEGCRFLQHILDIEVVEDVRVIFQEVNSHVVELMTDQFGNYLCQKLFETCNDEQRTILVNYTVPHLENMATHPHGTRAVQKMIECISTPDQVQLLIHGLRGCVVELAKHQNGNHVVQSCLARFRSEPENLQFFIDAMRGNLADVATHRQGTCVLQRCVDFASASQQKQLVAEAARDIIPMSQDPYGNYFVQYMLGKVRKELARTIMFAVMDNISTLSTQKFSSNVALLVAHFDQRRELVRKLLATELSVLLRDPYANYVIQTALKFADSDMQTKLMAAIRPHLPAIIQLPHGRKIANLVDETERAAAARRAKQTAIDVDRSQRPDSSLSEASNDKATTNPDSLPEYPEAGTGLISDYLLAQAGFNSPAKSPQPPSKFSSDSSDGSGAVDK